MGRFVLRHLRALAVVSAVLLSMLLSPHASAAVFVDGAAAVGWGVNGTVFATVIIGDTVVVGGTFTQAVSPTNQMVPRQNLAAFSLSTGDLISTWRADTDGEVSALATDGTAVYAGGVFLHVAGAGRPRLAKLNAATGAVDPTFSPNVNGGVKAIEPAGASLYIAGAFGAVNGAKHGRVAKLDATTGAPFAAFTASTNRTAYGLVRSPSDGTIWVCGLFDSVNGTARLGLSGLDPDTGAVVGPAFGNTDVPMYGLDISPDGSRLYGAQKSNQGSAWRVDTGQRVWRVGTDGNVQAVKYYDGTVYFGFHDGYQGDTTIKLLAVNAANGAVDASFRPPIDSFYGVHSIDASPGGLVIGGAFKNVSGHPALRVAIFRP